MERKNVFAFLNKILSEVLEELAPVRVLHEKLEWDGRSLHLEGHRFSGPFYLLSVGKAAWDSAAALAPLLGESLLGGAVLTRYGGAKGVIPGLCVFEAGHPLPDEAGLSATGMILAEIERLPDDVTVIACISGGGSALFEDPLSGITLADLVALNRLLLKSGASIEDINVIRKGISRVKGGGLLECIRPRACLGLLFSDVVGDEPGLIASGPTVPWVVDERWREVCERYGLWDRLPGRVLEVLEAGTRLPVASQGRCALAGRVNNFVLLGNGDLCERTRRRLEGRFHTFVLSSCISGEAVEVGRFLGDVAREVQASGNPVSRPMALVTGGEAVVTVRGSGKGGPNLETALSFARQVRGLPDTWFLSVDSDGSDGGTEAAGAIVDGQTWDGLVSAGHAPGEGLRHNDSLSLLDAAGCLVVTGPTGTNLNDLRVILMP